MPFEETLKSTLQMSGFQVAMKKQVIDSASRASGEIAAPVSLFTFCAMEKDEKCGGKMVYIHTR